MAGKKTGIVIGASHGIGGAVVRALLDRGYNVVKIADAVVYLAEARTVTGEVLRVDGGAHAGRW